MLLSKHQVLVHTDPEYIYPSKARVEHLDKQKLHTKGAGEQVFLMLLLKLTNFLHSIEPLILHQKGETLSSLSLTPGIVCVYPKQIMCCCVI
jgi:hypothetical protein